MRVQFILSEIFIGLRRNVAMAISVVLVTLVALFMLGFGMLAQRQAGVMKDYWYDRVQVSIFLCNAGDTNVVSCADGAVTDAQKDQIAADLKSPQLAPYIQKVYFETQQEAYQRFKDQYEDSVLSENVTPDQMPESYRVQLKDPTQYEVISSVFQDRSGVRSVEDRNEVLDRLFALLNGLKIGSWVIALVTLGSAVLLVWTTVRLTAFSRRRETGIMRLVGASNLVIQLPFILETMFAAVVGAALACGALVGFAHFVMQGWLAKSVRIADWVGVSDAVAVMPWLFAVGLVIAGVSSFFSLMRYLRV